MGESTEIAWTDHTFNPWHGCARVSPGCENCYAEAFAARIGHGKRLPMIWGVNAERKFFGDKHWSEPRKWNEKAAKQGVRRRVFCASMADVFEDREDLIEHREKLFRLIDGTTSLDWLLLTKRPQNVNRLVPVRQWGTLSNTGLPPNVWIGTTVEDQKRANERIPELLKLPARVRFLSCEPLLEAVDLTDIHESIAGMRVDGRAVIHVRDALRRSGLTTKDYPEYRGVQWVIVGGESGPGARPFDFGWARSIIRQCKDAGVACFAKQMGARARSSIHTDTEGDVTEWFEPFKDRKGGDWNEWPEDLRVREWPASATGGAS